MTSLFFSIVGGLAAYGFIGVLFGRSSAPYYWPSYSQQFTSMRRNTNWKGCVFQTSERLREEYHLKRTLYGVSTTEHNELLSKANRPWTWTATKWATFDQAAAAIGRAFAHSEHHRSPQLMQTSCSTVSPVDTSIAVSTRSEPSHVLHRTNSVSIQQRICRIEPDICPNLLMWIAVRGPRRKSVLLCGFFVWGCLVWT